MPNRIPDPRAGGPEGNRLSGAVSINRPSAEKVGAANAPTTAANTHGAPAHPAVDLLVGGSQTQGVYEDNRLPIVVRTGAITVTPGRPISARVLAPARLVVILTPAEPAELLAATAARDILRDDRAALLAAAGISTLPTLRPA